MAGSGEISGAVLDSDQGGMAVDLQPLFEKLKPGPGLPPDQVIADQRRRLHGAMIALVDQSGWSTVRVRSLARAAGVSTATFYKHFVNTDDCLASTYDAVMDEVVRLASSAQRRQTDWKGAVRATVATISEALAADPRATNLVLVDVFAGGLDARKRTGSGRGKLEQLLADSFADAPREVIPPRHLVAGMTAGLIHVARTTALTGRADEIPRFTGEISDWMLALPGPEILSLLIAPSDESDDPRREAHPFPAEALVGGGSDVTGDRERLLRAAAKLVAREGFGNLTAPGLRREAGVSRRRFESFFENLEECFLEAVEATAGDAAARAQAWSAETADWERRTCRFVLAVCAQAARNRTAARLAFLGVFAAGRAGLIRRERMVGRVAARLRPTVPSTLRPSPIVTEASVAAAWHIAQSDVAAGRTRGLPVVAPLLSYVVLAPLIGPQTATAAIRAEVGTVRSESSWGAVN
jgi:AcrR family transcriptional regulator